MHAAIIFPGWNGAKIIPFLLNRFHGYKELLANSMSLQFFGDCHGFDYAEPRILLGVQYVHGEFPTITI